MTDFIDATTIASITVITSTIEREASIDAAIIKTTSTPSILEIYGAVDSAIITSKTSLLYDERGPFTDLATVQSSTILAVLIELLTTIKILLSGSAIVGATLTATIEIDVPTATNTGAGSSSNTSTGTFVGTGTSVGGETVSSYVTPQGYWGSADDDDGQL